MKKTEKEHMTFSDWLVMGFFGLIVLSLVFKLLVWLGIVEDRRSHSYNASQQMARFDNKECLMRRSYYHRDMDPLLPDSELIDRVARDCVDERRAFEGW